MSHRAYPKTRLHLPRFVGGPVEPVRHVVADEDHAGAAVRRRAGLPAHAQRGAEGVEPLFHEGLSHLLRAHVRLVDHQEFTERIVSLAFNKLFFTDSSSTLDGNTSHLILFSSKIFFLTLLFDARIILCILVFYLINFYN